VRVLLFAGKGGVGKTTLAAATAALLARSGRKALALSTDPAHSLGDVLDTDLGGEPTEIDAGLFAGHVDTRILLDGAWSSLREHLRTVLAGAGVDELAADELTVLPGVEELLALTEVRRAAQTGPWEVVIVDCGPTAETLRLLALPEAISGYLERLFPAHRRAVSGLIAGIAGVQSGAQPATARWEATADALGGLAEGLAGLRRLLADHETTSIRLVLTPERLVAAESRRTLTALALHGLRVDGLIANQVLPEPPLSARGPAARWLRSRHAEQRAVLDGLHTVGLPLRMLGYADAAPVGVARLANLGRELYRDDDPLAGAAAAPLLAVRRTAGAGADLDSRFELDVALRGADRAPLELARLGDELVITIGGTRRLIALPSVLRRCTVTDARLDRDRLTVGFRPDPAVWMR
jgi:arsenite-transporting ATPase